MTCVPVEWSVWITSVSHASLGLTLAAIVPRNLGKRLAEHQKLQSVWMMTCVPVEWSVWITSVSHATLGLTLTAIVRLTKSVGATQPKASDDYNTH